MEIDSKYKPMIARMRNLKLYANSSDEEIYEAILRKERAKELGIEPVKNDTNVEQQYKELFKKLQAEYGVDMNDSNDVESLKMLAQHNVQLSAVNKQINEMASRTLSNEDTRTLKNLGDFQRSLVTSITELQDRLGISRKARKDNKVDTVPAFIEKLKAKSQDYWNRTTVPVMCDTCKIELVRYWLNFPKHTSVITMEVQCPKCGQKVLYVR